MKLWQEEHPDIANFCGTMFLADDAREDSGIYPSEPLDHQQLSKLEPNISLAYLESLREVSQAICYCMRRYGTRLLLCSEVVHL